MVNGYKATSLEEALQIKSEHPEAVPYQGGTDLMVENRKHVEYLFLNQVPELKRIYTEGDVVHIGAGATFTEGIESEDVPEVMKEALRLIAAPAIRNAGTFGGNIGNGSAKADSVLIDFATDANLVLASVKGERVVPIDQFYLGRKKLAIEPDEIIKEIQLPAWGLDNYYYQKVGGRKALAISRVSFCGIFRQENGTIQNAAAAFGAVAGTVLRYKDIEATIVGKTIEEAHAMRDEYLAAYADSMQLTRGRVSAEYRKAVCMNLLGDFLAQNGI
jgi:CO/xanthine dehydrogenase FAD-binding subunit